MNKQAFTTLEYQHLLALIKRNAQTEPGQRRVEGLSPIDDVSELRRELAALSECVTLRNRGVKWWFNGLTDPAEAIAQEAERFRADAICLASHGRTGLGKAFLGSVTEGVMTRSRRPVLIVRADQE